MIIFFTVEIAILSIAIWCLFYLHMKDEKMHKECLKKLHDIEIELKKTRGN